MKLLSSQSSPVSVVNLADVEREAYKSLTTNALDYYRSGATSEITLAENVNAFDRIRIRPRVLHKDVTNRDLSTSVLGIPVQFPVCVSPTAMQRMATPMGEIDNAMACAQEGTIMTLSTISTTSLEDVARSSPNSPKFFQLYIYKDRSMTEKLIRRAENSGFKALVLTVDTPFMGQRYADERNGFRLPPHLRMANFDANSAASNQINTVEDTNKPSSGLTEYTTKLFDQSLTWKDVDWLRSITHLPIVVKGVLTREDALIALEHKVDAIMVSNHGGRQLDTVPATVNISQITNSSNFKKNIFSIQIEALIEVVDAVQGQCEVYLDGGVRRGTDVKFYWFYAKWIFNKFNNF